MERQSHRVGDVLRVEIEKVAHGGHFIARLDGAVFFIRHAIPGEIVDIVVTSVEKSFYRADVTAVIEASPDRITPHCSYAKPGLCGGCDFQHISQARILSLKSEVIAEQFARIAKMEIDCEVEDVSTPYGWRTRMAATTDSQGVAGFKSQSSHHVIPISHCPVLKPEIDFPTLRDLELSPDSRIEVSLATSGERTVTTSSLRESGSAQRNPVTILEGSATLLYEVNSISYQVSHSSFWQSNVKAPEILVDAVLNYAQPRTGEHFLDLYGGVGLFTGALLPVLGAGGRVDLIEGSDSATRDARKNFAAHSNVNVLTGDVAREIKKIKRADVIILDPPRIGAGKAVVDSITSMSARAIIYVACDPAALARDTGYLRERGYILSSMRAFDLFPQSHHIESVALYLPNKVS